MRSEKGQAIVELALALSLLLVLGLGMVDVGRVLHAYLAATNASREGCRVAALGYNDSQVLAAVNASLGSLYREANLVVTVSPEKEQRVQGSPVKVEVKLEIPILFPGFGAFAEDPLPVVGETTMRLE
ncbi:MAG: pilus assembly protein [Firmicutes bacterium]|nr:pilus assembly protein [Bacillota bacterium]